MSGIFREQSKSSFGWVQSAWLISALLAALGLLSPNPLESAVAVVMPVALLQILWRPGEPQVLALAALLQSFQVIIPVWTANRDGLKMASLMASGSYSKAFLISSLALLCLAAAARVGAGNPLSLLVKRNQENESHLKVNKLLLCYIVSLLISFVVPPIAFRLSGLTQLILPFASIRFVFAFLIFKQVFDRRAADAQALFILLVEIIIGITGFFGGFKFIFYLTAVAALSSRSGLSSILRPKLIMLLALLILFGSYWQAVKNEYRGFVSGGFGQQIVVTLPERLAFHRQALVDFQPELLAEGFTSGLDRIGYLAFFAGSIDYVPARVPHQDGKLWTEAIEFVLKPRLFFPDKAVANDSDRTNAYSGFLVADADKGVSISIGYVGESYIDFGFPILLVPVAALGWIYGRLYRLLLLVPPGTPLNYGAASVFILGAATTYESSNLKILPAVFLGFLAYWFLLKLFARQGSNFWHWLTVA